ncbi:MAG TPA: AAA family ATPase [Candidatus Dormibacteraeota bacterium]|nr:AAA family ATPase [Candidatus Dormibacteraeota bacterium]
MKLAIAGKGGTGKTTISGIMAREFAASGRRVTAIDVDPNPTLSQTIGVNLREAEAAATLPDDAFERVVLPTGEAVLQLTVPVDQVIASVGLQGPDGITLVVAGRVEHAARGCNCHTHAAVRAVLAAIAEAPADVVMLDMEAGVEHFSRAGGTLKHADALLILVEPFYKSLVTARSVVSLSGELGIPLRYVVANKVRDDNDLVAIDEFCEKSGLERIAVVPWDQNLQDAETREEAPIDYAPDSPGVTAARKLAATVLELLGATAGA